MCGITFKDEDGNIQRLGTDNPLPVGGSFNTKSVQILAGASLSNEVDLNGHQVVAIYMPGTWTTANLTFSASNVTGGTFNNVYDSAGNELTVTAAASRTLVDIPELEPIRFLRIRSGTSGTPVNQLADRTLILILK